MMIKRVNLKFCSIIYFVLYILHFKISPVKNTDDTWFADASSTAPFLEWITMRYTTWSGRLLPDTLLYVLLDEFLWIWRLLNPAFLIILAYGIVRVFKKEVTRWELLCSLVLLGYISYSVLNSGLFWITGSMNYLWPISLGLTGMLPFVHHIFKQGLELNGGRFSLFVLMGLLAALSNEQVGLCMSSFAFLSVLIMLQRKNIDKRLLLYTVLIIAATCILLLAPGNKQRWILEASHWFPGYDDLTLKDHIHLGLIWLYKQLFIELRNLILLLAVMIFFVFYKRKAKQSWAFYLFTFLLFTATATVFLGQSEFYDFDLIKEYRIGDTLLHFWQIDFGFVLAILPYAFWTIFGFVLAYLVIRFSKNPFFIFLCLAAALTTMIMMFFSPTIYASETRPLVVGSVLLSMVVFSVVHENKLVTSFNHLLILSCLPLLTFLQLFLSW